MEQACRISEGKDTLKTLRVLTENLPDFGDLILSHSSAGSVETKTKSGTSIGFNLLYEPKIAVAKWFGSKDSVFPAHKHDEIEWIIVYSGSVELKLTEGVKVLKEGDYICLPPNTPHGASFYEDCWYIAITIPASKDWPQ